MFFFSSYKFSRRTHDKNIKSRQQNFNFFYILLCTKFDFKTTINPRKISKYSNK